ncbi:hypothetical protein [Chryseobacterium sp. CCH4-E10]|uniref:hypothetical protein n=1 Tax=Chryseobacterium sp. CCH4-E10 TaxID=1768758 RepID=UPI000836F0B0|nr:hypothetical protein [Chryseobacterium sp. CCH4-E10]
MGYWKYEIVHDYDATKLIKEFREENLKLKNSKGTDDEETDFIVYAEKDDHTISLGRVLLIKMSDAMVKYHHEYKGTVDLPEYWAKYIYEQCKNNNTFYYNEDEIAEAFLESIKLQTKFVSVSALDVQNFIRKITESISDSFRKDERFPREQWDPTLKSDEYLFAEPEKAFNYFIQKCNSLKKTLKKVKDQLEILKSFKILGEEFKVQSIEDIIKGIDEQIKSIEDLGKWLIENRDDIKLKIPFLCGVWNGLVEFVGGFLDLALLAINITVSDLAGGETNLEFLEIREGVEEALGAVLKDPAKVFKDAIEGIKNYKYARYDDPKLNQYQIQHNEGEDLILAIDVAVTIVTIIKGIAKLAQQLSKFVKWVDEILARNPKLRERLRNFKIDNFIERNMANGKTIGNVSKEIIIRELHNVTEIATEVARALKKGRIKLVKLDEEAFYNAIKEPGESLKNIRDVVACQKKEIIYIKNSTSLDKAFGEIVHEGQHAFDEFEGLFDNIPLLREKTKLIVHDNISMKSYVDKMTDGQVIELRARIAEREFQIAAKQKSDFSSVSEMISFIFKKY